MRPAKRILEQLAQLYLNEPLKNSRRDPFRHAVPLHREESETRRGFPRREGSSSRPSPKRAGRPVNHPSEEDLEQHLAQSLAGAAPLAARCPHEHSVRMMVDEVGRIHLWRERVDRDISAGVVSLINARFWARENIELIALTQPEHEFDMKAEPMLHVFTSDADKASALDQTLGPCLRIHVFPPLHDRPMQAHQDSRWSN